MLHPFVRFFLMFYAICIVPLSYSCEMWYVQRHSANGWMKTEGSSCILTSFSSTLLSKFLLCVHVGEHKFVWFFSQLLICSNNSPLFFLSNCVNPEFGFLMITKKDAQRKKTFFSTKYAAKWHYRLMLEIVVYARIGEMFSEPFKRCDNCQEPPWILGSDLHNFIKILLVA